ncbi:MAG: hypothetical protein R6U37_05935 [Dehalococcoidia bacterium]
MDVELIRDWILIVYLGIGSVVVCVILAFSVILAMKLIGVLDATRETVDNVRDTSSFISRTVVQPLAKAQGLISGIHKIIEIVSSLTGKEEKKYE